MAPPRTYVALGDSMSIDRYTGVPGGGAVAQLYRRLQPLGWQLDDRTADGCRMELVDADARGDLITLTIGGNDLIEREAQWLRDGLEAFGAEHLALLHKLRDRNPSAPLLVANIYAPQTRLAEDLAVALSVANGMIRDNCKAADASVIDLSAAFAGREALLLVDDIEPNLAGASVIATLFLLELARIGFTAP